MTEIRLRKLAKKLKVKTGKDEKKCRKAIEETEDQNHRRTLSDSEMLTKAERTLKRYG